MSFKSAFLLTAALVLSACSAAQPRVIQASASNPDIVISVGMATQVEMPDQERVVSVAVGNKDLVSAEREGDVVTLSGKNEEGETNMIIRARDDDGDIKVFQYRVIVQK
ncbi:MAG: hypothetical protein PHE27_03330 [Alphaproteobacteria bacterium]|nr:hypothetical protein [Alphaproteobacteria bacterium]